MPIINIEKSYNYKLKSMASSKENITNTCNVPYHSLTIDYNSNCLICVCDGWLPVPVGRVEDFDSLEAVWNSPTAKIIQQDVDAQKFTWCAVDRCGVKHRSIEYKNYTLAINIDESCNLQCPSCRRDLIMHTAGPEFDYKVKNIERILTWLEKFDKPIHITLTGNGDPLASNIIRPLLQKYIPKPNQTFNFLTNGLLIKKQLSNLPILESITQISISVDAGSADVYEDVRRPGKFKNLIENFEFLKSIKKNHLVILSFVVQKNNYRDLDNFIDLCNHYGFGATIDALEDWGTWNHDAQDNPDSWTVRNGTFKEHNVADENHPEHNEYKQIITSAMERNTNPRIRLNSTLEGRFK